jgi:hypothetical protein
VASSDDDLRALLLTLDASARDNLRDVVIRDHADREAIASQLLRYRDQNGQGPRTGDRRARLGEVVGERSRLSFTGLTATFNGVSR